MEIDRCYALIHLNNILHNYRLIKDITQREVMAVVKADAYGHGSVEVAKHLEANGCGFFAVASLEEAIELRDAGIKGEILIFGKTTESNFSYLNQYNLIQTVDSLEYAKKMDQNNNQIRIHLNIDTGMSRFGFYMHEESDINKTIVDIVSISQMKNLKLEGIYTHFANADETDSGFLKKQYRIFNTLLDHLEESGVKGLLKHVANSAASLAQVNTRLDMVRVGIALYGYPPIDTVLRFKPGMEVFARVIAIKEILPGDTVSYGRIYKTEKKARIATVAIGYADGYNRQLSNRDYLVYKNQKLPVVGRVCMDAIMVDIGDADIKVGDVLEVFGFQKDLKHICKLLNTITYEPLCAVSKRVKRIYKK